MGASDSLTSSGTGLAFQHTTSALVLGLVHVYEFLLFLLAGISLINSIGLP